MAMNSRQKFSDADVASMLSLIDNGAEREEVAKKTGASVSSLYDWQQRFQGLEPAGIVRCRRMEQKINSLKKDVERLKLERTALKAILEKKS